MPPNHIVATTMNKMPTALLLVAAAMALGCLLVWSASNDTVPPSPVEKRHLTSAIASQPLAPQTNSRMTAQDLPPAMVAPDQVRENATAAAPPTNRDLPSVSAREPRSTAPGTRDSALAWPTSPSEPKSSRPPANTAPSISTSVSWPDPAPVVVDQEIPVPRGEPVPAAIMDEGYGASTAQVQSLDDIAGEFLDNALAPASPSQGDVQNWRSAARLADERYRTMFGVEAFNRWSIEAAKEALAERPQR